MNRCEELEIDIKQWEDEVEKAKTALQAGVRAERAAGRYYDMAENLARELKRQIETVALDDIPTLTQDRLLAEAEAADFMLRYRAEQRKNILLRAAIQNALARVAEIRREYSIESAP